MTKGTVANFFKNAQTSINKHSPEILTAIGIAGMIGSTIMAVRATPKAVKLIEERKAEERVDELHPVEVVKTAWKPYIPAVVTAAASTACLIKAVSVNTRRNAALLTAYNISSTALKEYQEKAKELVGERKDQTIHDHIAKDKLEKDPVQNREVIITEKGTTLCYDSMFGRYFKSDRDAIQRAFTQINREIVSNDYVSLNELFNLLGLEAISMGYDLGWNFDDGEIEPIFSSQIAADGTPCLVLGYNVAPKRKFNFFS